MLVAGGLITEESKKRIEAAFRCSAPRSDSDVLVIEAMPIDGQQTPTDMTFTALTAPPRIRSKTEVLREIARLLAASV